MFASRFAGTRKRLEGLQKRLRSKVIEPEGYGVWMYPRVQKSLLAKS